MRSSHIYVILFGLLRANDHVSFVAIDEDGFNFSCTDVQNKSAEGIMCHAFYSDSSMFTWFLVSCRLPFICKCNWSFMWLRLKT